MRSKRLVALAASCAVVASMLVVTASPARAEDWVEPKAQEFDFVEVKTPKQVAVKPDRVERAKLTKAAWPKAGEAEVSGVARSRSTKPAGDLPVSIAAPADAKKPVDAARVQLFDQTASKDLIDNGVIVAVTAEPGSQAEVTLDYATFADAAGGGYGNRLRWVQLPVCALDRPDDPECQTATPLESTNDAATQTLTAQVTLPEQQATPTPPVASGEPEEPAETVQPSAKPSQTEQAEPAEPSISPAPSESATTEVPDDPEPGEEPDQTPAEAEPDQTPAESAPQKAPAQPAAAESMMVLAAMAGVGGDQGSYGATSLKSSSMWQAGGSSGAFSWTYPLRTPPVAGALSPELAISYNSGSTDGAVSSTNNQASWVGEGFGLSMGFIERTFTSCTSDLPNRGTAPETAGEQCWWSDTEKTNNAPWDNATLNLGAHSGTLVRIGNTNQWRLKDDDGTRITKEGSPNTGGGVTEYWKVTTTDGTQYFFGKGKSDGSTTATDSRWAVPVGANHSGEPGYNATFASAIHPQAWRWNLDYVIDPSGDTMTVFYAKEINQYKKLGTTTVSYDRGGTIASIHYGERKGSESASPAAKVTFLTKERCDSTVLADCNNTTSPTPTPSTVAAWLDVPTDAICEAGYCPDIKSAPTFFSRKRLAEIHTWSRNTADSGYDAVDSWLLAGIFPATDDATSTPTWWLHTITHVGQGATTPITLPQVTLEPKTMRNRITGSSGNYGLNRPRLWRIADESGGRITVTYSGEDCTPTSLPGSPVSNTSRCFPVYYAANPGDTPTIHWFTKYVVSRVDVHDTSTATIGVPAVSGLDLSEDQVTSYTYSDGGAWRWDDSPFTPENQRTWNQWRGYGKTQTIAGKSGAPQTVTEQTWFRGMHGDNNGSGGTKTVDVVDSTNTPKPDLDVLAGQLRETRSLKSPAGAVDSREIYDLWVSAPTADDGRDQALMIDVAKTSATQYLAAGSRSTITEVKSRDTWGQPTMVEETGDTAVTGDEQCTRTTFATPIGTATAVDLIGQQSVMPALCNVAENQAQVTGWSRHFYDGSDDYTKVPGPGHETRTAFLIGATTRTWQTVSTATYDAHGRLTSATDALGRTSTTSYSPATLRAPRTITSTTPDPDGAGAAAPLVTTSTFDHRWGLQTKTVSPAGQITEAALDALGRVTAVWLPGRAKATQSASEKYTYVVNQAGTGVNAVRAESLLPDGTNYATTWSILDGLLRPRQIQTESVSTGSQVQDFRYDSRGNPVLIDNYLITAAPASTMVAPTLRANIKRSARATYDYATRPLDEALYSGEVLQWKTTTSYEGDRVKINPPTGGTPTTTVTDVWGRVTALTEHLGTTTAATGVTTNYTYNPAGLLATMTDPKGNKWSYTYDLAGNQLTTTDPDAGTTTMTYDEANRLLTTTDARGQGTSMVYDSLDRVTATKTLDGATTLTSAVYDTLKPGLITSSTRHVTSTAQLIDRVDTYDAYGRPTKTSTVVPAATGLIPAGLAGTYSVTTSYNPDGSLATMGLPATGPVNAETLTYGYNPKGAPFSLTGMASIVRGTAYTQWDTVSSMNMGAVTGQAIVAMFNRDEAALRLERIRTIRQVGGSTPDEDTTYAYDAAGNILQAKATLKSGLVDNQCFKYDYQGQLTEAFTAAAGVTCSGATPSQATLGTGPSPYWSSWTTDTIGKTSKRIDRTATASSTTNYAYPANGATAVRPHTVTQTVTTGSTSATRNYSYDAAGNTTSRPGPSGVAQTMSYDTEGNLVAVIQAGATIARMVYDAAGERVVRSEDGKTTLTVAGTDLTIVDATGVKTASRSYTHAGQTVAIRTGNTNADLVSVIADHQGTAHHQIRNSDSQLQTTWQNPYGDRRGTPPAVWAGQRAFVGGMTDVSTGLIRLGARDYDPLLQRFTTVDPVQVLEVPLQWNPYLYGDNSPITKADPTGECWICGIGNAIVQGAKAVAGTVKAAVSKAVTTVKRVATAVVKKVATVAAKVVKAAVNTVKAVAKAVTTAAKTVKAVVTTVVKKVTTKVKQVASTVKKTVNNAAKAAGNAIVQAGKAIASNVSDDAQLVLDVIGLIPVVGELADGANAVIYAAKGDYANAALSAAAMLPVGGQAATAAKFGIRGVNAAIDAGRASNKAADMLGATCKLNSFVPGTQVLMADGSTKQIEDVEVGDLVVATDPETGETSMEPVTDLITGGGVKQLVRVGVDPDGDGVADWVTATDGHPFWVNGTEWATAGDLVLGDLLMSSAGGLIEIKALDEGTMVSVVHNMTVDTYHTYYVVSGGLPLLVHNDGDSPVGTVFRDGAYRFQILSNDHAPAHGHLRGPGIPGHGIKIGQNGKPVVPGVTLTSAQGDVINRNLKSIRKAIGSYMKWHKSGGC